ncbi:hypothetical protein PLESTB_001286900 [Pleodorina starrii]|uniref:Uncharacterized protein n=1 Tax=Pleodorina starrii TaxID=330485 RepID=A0A9W6F6A1_9CHLO|nr:hypothetical protein PLESTB_001286900 [Pleodorina starrii]
MRHQRLKVVRPNASVHDAAELILANASRNAGALRAAGQGFAGLPTRTAPSARDLQVAEDPMARKLSLLSPPFGRYSWNPQELEIMVQVARNLPARAVAPVNRLMRLLEWDHIVDPEKKLRQRIRDKFYKVRAMLYHGADPMEQAKGRKKMKRNRGNTYTAWIRKAFASLPDGQVGRRGRGCRRGAR